jgi:hypothetical protein
MIKRAKRRAVGSGTRMSGDSVSNSAAKISGGSVMSTPRPCSAAVYALRPLCSALHELVLDRWPHRCKSINWGARNPLQCNWGLGRRPSGPHRPHGARKAHLRACPASPRPEITLGKVPALGFAR